MAAQVLIPAYAARHSDEITASLTLINFASGMILLEQRNKSLLEMHPSFDSTQLWHLSWDFFH